MMANARICGVVIRMRAPFSPGVNRSYEDAGYADQRSSKCPYVRRRGRSWIAHSSAYSAAACGRASWIARHTRSGVAGISMWRTP